MTRAAPYEGGVWHRLHFHVVASSPQSPRRLSGSRRAREVPRAWMEPPGPPGGWREFAVYDPRSVTRVLLDDGEVIAFYTLSSGQAEIRDASKRDVLSSWAAQRSVDPISTGLLGPRMPRLCCLGCDPSRRLRGQRTRAPRGKGAADARPLLRATDRMWREWGFELTDTPSSTDESSKRLYIPLP